jgi:hypothetical protein
VIEGERQKRGCSHFSRNNVRKNSNNWGDSSSCKNESGDGVRKKKWRRDREEIEKRYEEGDTAIFRQEELGVESRDEGEEGEDREMEKMEKMEKWRRDGEGMEKGWRRDGEGMEEGWRRDGEEDTTIFLEVHVRKNSNNSLGRGGFDD